MLTPYHWQTDGQRERTNHVLEGYLRTFVNQYQNDWYQLLPLAEPAYIKSATDAHKMTPFFPNYSFHAPTEWMKEREAQNPGATMYSNWMQDIHQQVKQTLEDTWETIKKYYNRKTTEQPNIGLGDLEMFKANNTSTKWVSKGGWVWNYMALSRF